MHAAQIPTALRKGLRRDPAPGLRAGAQIRCIGCGCSVDPHHTPHGDLCEELAWERFTKNREENLE